MAEAAGIIIECSMTEAALSGLMQQQVEYQSKKIRIGRLLAQLFADGDAAGDIMIVHIDQATQTLFFAWILSRFESEAFEPIWPIITRIAQKAGSGIGVVASILPQAFEAVSFENGKLIRASYKQVDDILLARLSQKLWSFAQKDQFPDASSSMRRRNYQSKPFRNAWKAYLKWLDEEEKPARIAAATKDNPYKVNREIFIADGKVYRWDYSKKRAYFFPKADPLTFRIEAGYYADKNYVWRSRLAKNSPPSQIIDENGEKQNNPAAIWQYEIIPNMRGKNFHWLFDRWDTVYWTDGDFVYCSNNKNNEPHFIVLPDVIPSQFQRYGYCFATNGKKVFCDRFALPINTQRMQTKKYFIWDDHKVFYCNKELPLKGKGFKILADEYLRYGNYYRLTDGDTTIVLGPYEIIFPDELEFIMANQDMTMEEFKTHFNL